MGFGADHLTDIYIRTLAPSVWSAKHKKNLPVYVVYADVMEILEKSVERDGGKYKETVLGASAVEKAPQEYWDLGIMTDMHITPTEWLRIPIIDKAKLRAFRYLKNMVDVVERHYTEQKNAVRDIANKAGS